MNDATTTTTVQNKGPEGEDLEVFLGAPTARPWYRNPTYVAAVVALLVLILFLARCFSGTAEAGYATEEVRRGNLRVTVSATGNLLPTNQVEVGSEQSGLVDQVYVDNNDRVVKGQPLARLDPARLRDTLIQAQAGLAAAQAQVATANATLVQARANLGRLEQVWRLSGGKVPSRVELDTGRAEAQRAVAGVRAAQAQVTQAQAQVSSAHTNLSKATLYSPVTGVVLSRNIDPGQTVAASFQAPVLFTLAEDLGQMRLEVKVDEADVGQVKEGQRATFTVDAYPGRTFPATITRVDVGANASGGTAAASNAASGNVVAYTAVLSVQNPELILRPGMTATAEIVTTEKRDVLLVPNAALRYSPEREAAAARSQSGGVTSVLIPQRPGRGGRGGGGRGGQREASIGRGSRQTVYVLGVDNMPKPVRIVVGESNGAETEVVSGDLKPGAKVITGRLAPGQTQEKSRPRWKQKQDDGEQPTAAPQPATGKAAAPAAPAAAPSAAQNGKSAAAQPATPVAAQKAGPTAQKADPTAQRTSPDAAPAPRAGGRGDGGGRGRFRDMTREQRRAYFESLSPEERAAMQERRRQRRAARGQAEDSPDGQ